MQNNYYSFIDLGNNQMKYFNADQLSKYLGLNNPTYIGSNNYVVQSYNNLR